MGTRKAAGEEGACACGFCSRLLCKRATPPPRRAAPPPRGGGAGVVLVLAYTAAVYWVFRGKVKINPTSY